VGWWNENVIVQVQYRIGNIIIPLPLNEEPALLMPTVL
jgi:hypothetical protein